MQASPTMITSLAPNEIFVFGSNTLGRHGAGAARIAVDRFGAIYGQPFGLQGQSYAIITEDGETFKKRSVPLSLIEGQVEYLVSYAKTHPELTFLVTKIGCGLAGFKDAEIASIFGVWNLPKNVHIPQDFIDVINGIKSNSA